MKKHVLLCMLIPLSPFIAFFAAGCETDSADAYSLSVTPAAVTIQSGSAISLKASGGWSYRWSLGDSSLGYISSSTGETITYYSHSAMPGFQKVSVYGVGTGSSTNASIPVATVGITQK